MFVGGEYGVEDWMEGMSVEIVWLGNIMGCWFVGLSDMGWDIYIDWGKIWFGGVFVLIVNIELGGSDWWVGCGWVNE